MTILTASLRRLALVAAGAALAIGVTSAPAQAASVAPAEGALPPVESLDINRYLGPWRELASVPQFVTSSCRKNSRVSYGLENSTTITVRNSCDAWWGDYTVTGLAYVTDAQTQAQLAVHFDFMVGPPRMTTNYVVTHLAEDYSWAVVGNPKRSLGWVLSRTPDASPQRWREILAVLRERGYDLSRVRTTIQDGGLARQISLSMLDQELNPSR